MLKLEDFLSDSLDFSGSINVLGGETYTICASDTDDGEWCDTSYEKSDDHGKVVGGWSTLCYP